jgi:hypothetical protein
VVCRELNDVLSKRRLLSWAGRLVPSSEDVLSDVICYAATVQLRQQSSAILFRSGMIQGALGLIYNILVPKLALVWYGSAGTEDMDPFDVSPNLVSRPAKPDPANNELPFTHNLGRLRRHVGLRHFWLATCLSWRDSLYSHHMSSRVVE